MIVKRLDLFPNIFLLKIQIIISNYCILCNIFCSISWKVPIILDLNTLNQLRLFLYVQHSPQEG